MLEDNIFVQLLKLPEMASVVFSILMSVLYALMKLYIKNKPDVFDKVKAVLEFPINLCCIFTTALVAVEISKGIDLKYATIIFLLSLLISFFCCIFRNNANAVLLYEKIPKLKLICWGFLDWLFSLVFGSIMFFSYCL